MVLGQISGEVQQQVDHLRCAKFQRSDDDRTSNKLRMTIIRVTYQVRLISRVHLPLTCHT